MSSKSKNKGNAAERALAAQLTEWTGADWKRVPNSGALRWSGATWAYGDLLPPPDWKVVVESKHYADVDLAACLQAKEQGGNILGWWNQVYDDAVRCYTETGEVVEPLLIYRANRKKPHLVIRWELYEMLIQYINHPKDISYMSLHREHYSLVVFVLEHVTSSIKACDFLKAVNYSRAHHVLDLRADRRR